MRQSRVLIADGDSRLRSQLYTRLLDVELFSDCISNATDGFEYLRERTYALVLVDLELPNGEAWDLIDRVRLIPGERRPMVLATVGREPFGVLDPDIVQIVMRKPLRLAELAEMIRSCIDSRNDAMARRDQRARRGLDAGSGNEDPVGVVR
jgi:DNA-binding response OmpR family regulator